MAKPARVPPRPEFNIRAGIGNAQRIKDVAKAKKVDIGQATERFTLECAIRRIFGSEHAERFGLVTLKGGSLMHFSEGVEPINGRATRDIDIEMIGYQGTLENVQEKLRAALSAITDPDDGVRFHVDDMHGLPVQENRAVAGGKIMCPVQIGGAVYTFKMDVGFHPLEAREDIIYRDYVSLLPLKMPAFRVPCRPVEYALADKIQACSRHGKDNTRLRDYYDMTVFFRNMEIDLDRAALAVSKIFGLYGTPDVPARADDFAALSDDFATSKSADWDELRAQGYAVLMPPLEDVVKDLRDNIQPILDRVHSLDAQHRP